jgi:hypothetical protein
MIPLQKFESKIEPYLFRSGCQPITPPDLCGHHPLCEEFEFSSEPASCIGRVKERLRLNTSSIPGEINYDKVQWDRKIQVRIVGGLFGDSMLSLSCFRGLQAGKNRGINNN